MRKVCYFLLLCLLSSCKMNKANHVETSKADFVIQDSEDTVRTGQVLEKAADSKKLGIELTADSNYSQKQLLSIQEELRQKLEKSNEETIKRNVMGYGVRLNHIEIDLIVNTPEKRKEFKEKIMDSPAFRFYGVETPVINEKVGVNHIHGIYIRPEYSVYSTEAEQATFILNNYSGKTIKCGEHYYITFEDENGIWRELPIHTAFIDIGYGIQDKGERRMKASLYPDLHPNKPGRYRYFYEVMMNRKFILMMAEFRLTDNKQVLKEAIRTPLPEGLLKENQNESLLLTEEELEEPVYEVVESMPEFPGGMHELMNFIEKNVRYPEVARKHGMQGRVIVRVVIDKDGSVTEPTIVRSIDTELDNEALRIVKLMPKWKPGTQRNKAVKVKYTFPVTFRLADSMEKR